MKKLNPDEIFDNSDGLLDDFVYTGKGSSKKVKRQTNPMKPKTDKDTKMKALLEKKRVQFNQLRLKQIEMRKLQKKKDKAKKIS